MVPFRHCLRASDQMRFIPGFPIRANTPHGWISCARATLVFTLTTPLKRSWLLLFTFSLTFGLAMSLFPAFHELSFTYVAILCINVIIWDGQTTSFVSAFALRLFIGLLSARPKSVHLVTILSPDSRIPSPFILRSGLQVAWWIASYPSSQSLSSDSDSFTSFLTSSRSRWVSLLLA